MLVYGDRSEWAHVDERLDLLREGLSDVREMPAGLRRHSKLVGGLIEAGQLLQGAADASLDSAHDLNRFTYALAHNVIRSWDSRFAECGELPRVPPLSDHAEVELRVPEGFAFYAVYPEAYAHAAQRLRLVGLPRVIGIRSIGTTLGAIVAAALGAPPPITARPFGDPYARQVELPADMLDDRSHYVIVDEGPGLSGSSFGSVADWLQRRGVPLDRIAFVPSHGGEPGPQASEAQRRRWPLAQRIPAEFDFGWLADCFGPLEPLRIGERLKFIGWRRGERVLLKFAGLGAIGERKLELARALHGTGSTAEPLGIAHGFIIERWFAEGRPLADSDAPVGEIGRYIGARARLMAVESGSGASVNKLIEMCRRNIALALGSDRTRLFDGFDSVDLASRVSRVRTDNKLDRDKWLRLSDGRLIKTDALDHHQGHDLIGCQDAVWDIAGAIAEFELSDSQAEGLIAATGLSIDPTLLAFSRIAYLAFRLGQATLTGQAAATMRYSQQLETLLHQHACRATRHDSLVG